MDLLKKLKIKTDEPLWLVNAPEGCIPLFAGVETKHKLTGKKPVAQMMLFAMSSDELLHELARLAPYIAGDTLLWACYPKKSGAISSNLADMGTWDGVWQAGYRPQTSVAVNDDWTGLRITNAPPKKPSTYNLPPEERNIEGIDFVTRTVHLPPDAAAALAQHEGMTEFFNAMAFTHKKEYMQAIAEAKKPETRTRRIKKTVEMLAERMSAKSGK